MKILKEYYCISNVGNENHVLITNDEHYLKRNIYSKIVQTRSQQSSFETNYYMYELKRSNENIR